MMSGSDGSAINWPLWGPDRHQNDGAAAGDGSTSPADNWSHDGDPYDGEDGDGPT